MKLNNFKNQTKGVSMPNFKEVASRKSFLKDLQFAFSGSEISGNALFLHNNKFEFKVASEDKISAFAFQGWTVCASNDTLVTLFPNVEYFSDSGETESLVVANWMASQN